jgi:hypothetical protein
LIRHAVLRCKSNGAESTTFVFGKGKVMMDL